VLASPLCFLHIGKNFDLLTIFTISFIAVAKISIY